MSDIDEALQELSDKWAEQFADMSDKEQYREKIEIVRMLSDNDSLGGNPTLEPTESFLRFVLTDNPYLDNYIFLPMIKRALNGESPSDGATWIHQGNHMD